MWCAQWLFRNFQTKQIIYSKNWNDFCHLKLNKIYKIGSTKQYMFIVLAFLFALLHSKPKDLGPMTLEFKLGPIRGHVCTCFTFWPITFELFQPINASSSCFPYFLLFHITWGNVWKNSPSSILFDLTYYHLSHESWLLEPWKWSYLGQHLDLQCNNY